MDETVLIPQLADRRHELERHVGLALHQLPDTLAVGLHTRTRASSRQARLLRAQTVEVAGLSVVLDRFRKHLFFSPIELSD